MGRLDDRVAIVTGAGRGIGAATAKLFAEQGAAVVVNDVDKDPAQEVVEAITKAGGRALLNVDNTVNAEASQNLINATVEEFGKLDILVNNAGITRDKTFHNMDDEQWDFVLDVNLRTAFNNSRAAVRHMRDAAKKELETTGAPAYHRKITFTSSTAGIQGNAGQANYTTAKMGLVGLTRTLAVELGRFHINSNAVAPGFIETRLTQSKEQSTDPNLGIPESLRGMALMMIPMGYYGQPEDVAKSHLFLSSSDSDYVTGQLIVVGGGLVRY
ncbi:MAG TPA: SDR family oxidoreductase [Actinomycetota bacterium]|nr:SDR family oxidoreductase [Actinomycetota bacterium]